MFKTLVWGSDPKGTRKVTNFQQVTSGMYAGLYQADRMVSLGVVGERQTGCSRDTPWGLEFETREVTKWRVTRVTATEEEHAAWEKATD